MDVPTLVSSLLSSLGLPGQVGPLHGAVSSTPVPHWLVLLVVVPALWLLVGGIVFAIDRLLRRRGW